MSSVFLGFSTHLPSQLDYHQGLNPSAVQTGLFDNPADAIRLLVFDRISRRLWHMGLC